jgi:heme exporter protein D
MIQFPDVIGVIDAIGRSMGLTDYVVEVLSAYAVSILLLVVIIALSVRRSRKVRRQLDAVETRREQKP